ncbi:EthD domain-containing protein [Pseudomonas sp. MYb185]|uniref:EthD domain-containing protein n=1 Tax=Pseudomonas sp. MYb185 TaxID=1848729 RepID=UPI000CFB6B06|nr:EthD domain-containing protein [Pseudomonas sp. MYb185]PRB83964.1 hypothetical protein CQ007_03845 [Pseudomonas sp. MYb185]
MKAVSLISRRADLGRTEFRHYYENTHCWLAMQHFPFRRYVRNHVLDQPQLDFDCISEFELAEDLSQYDLMASRSRQLILDDEQQFMDQSRIRIAAATEYPLIVPAAEVPAERLESQVLLLQLEEQPLRAVVEQLARRLADTRPDLHAMRLDLLHSDPQRPFPCNALLWLDWLDRREAVPARLNELPGLLHELWLVRSSTAPSQLQERFVAFQP